MCEVVFQHHSEAGEEKSSPTYLFSVGTEILINSVSAVLFIIGMGGRVKWVKDKFSIPWYKNIA